MMQKRPGLRQPGGRNFRPPNAVGPPPNELEPWFKDHPHLAPRGSPVQRPVPRAAHVSQRQPARCRLPNEPFHHPRHHSLGHVSKNTSAPDNKNRKATYTSTKSTSHVNSNTGKISDIVVDNSPFTRPERNELWDTVGFAYLWRNFENAKGNELKDVLIEIHSRLTRDEPINVGLMRPETFETFTRIIGSERIELRCIACSALNMILISDVQAHHYRSILLQKDQSLLRFLSSVLSLEGLGHCDRLLQLKLLTEACALIYTLCSDDRVKKFNSNWPAWEGVTKGVIGLCSRKSLLFDFTDDQRRKVEEEIVGQQLKAEVVKQNCSSREGEQSCILHDVQIVKEEKQVALKEQLIKPGLLWRDPEAEEGTYTNVESERTEIRVSAVVSPSEVYAHIGHDAFQAVTEIEECLVSYVKKSPEMLAGPPQTSTFVILCDRKVPCRCQVKGVEDRNVTVQALDYGFTTQVHYRNLCWLQPGIFPKKYNKQAIRCKLKGFTCGTRSAKDLGLCLSILINLSKEVSLLESCFAKDDVIEALTYIATCPSAGLVRHSMRVLFNMTRSRSIRPKLCSSDYVTLLFDKLKTDIAVYSNKNTAVEIVQVAMETLSNMMFKNRDFQDRFMACSGINVVLNVLKPDTNDSIFQALCQLISNFVDSYHVRNALEYEKNTRWQSLANIPTVERAFSVMLPPDERPSHRRSRSSSASRCGSQAAGGANRPRSHSRGRLYSQDVGPASGIDAALDLKELDIQDSSSEDENPSHIDKPSSSELSTAVTTFKKGQRIEPDVVHCEYFQAVFIQEVELLEAIQVIVGFLNAGRDGKIYIGVINNTVKGIKISRDHKDRLRQGVDAMMKEKIEPMVYLNQYDVIFHAIEGDLHVIEISVRPTSTKPLTCYRAQIHDRVVRSYFIRDLSNGETLPLSAQMVHERIVKEKENVYLAEMASLQRELEKLEQSSQGKSHSSQPDLVGQCGM